MSRSRIMDAVISLAVGILIAVFSTALEILKELEIGQIKEWISSASGSAWYIAQRLKHFV